MPSALEVATDHYTQQRNLALDTAEAGMEMWGQVNFADLAGSWLRFMARLLTIVQGAQVTAASRANGYVEAVLGEQNLDVPSLGRVPARSLSGVASDGRPLMMLLMNPVVAAKAAVAHGAASDRAFAAGSASLEMTLRTQVADAGRVADGVAVAARPKVGYTRMLVGDSCPRCVILAGRFYRYSAGFERHPQCDCVHIPTSEDVSEDVTTDPMKAFEQGRVKGLSEADTRAIRDGADISQVVNAHKGMYVAGAQKATRTGTSRRSLAGKRLGRGAVRLMPEQIYRDATSRADAVRLLQLHGYLI